MEATNMVSNETVQQQIARITSWDPCSIIGCDWPYGHDGKHEPHARAVARWRQHAEFAACYGNAAAVALALAQEDGYYATGLRQAQTNALNAWRHAQHVDSCRLCVDGGCAVPEAATCQECGGSSTLDEAGADGIPVCADCGGNVCGGGQ